MAKGDLFPTNQEASLPVDAFVISTALVGMHGSVDREMEIIDALRSHTETHLRSWYSGFDKDVIGRVELWVNALRISSEFDFYHTQSIMHWKIESSTSETRSRAEFVPRLSLLEEIVSVIAGAIESFIFFDGMNDVVASVVLNEKLAFRLAQLRQISGLSEVNDTTFKPDFASRSFRIRSKDFRGQPFEMIIGFDGSLLHVQPEDQRPDWTSILPRFHLVPVPTPTRRSEFDMPWPTQDGLDRSNSFAIVNGDLPDEALAEGLGIRPEEVDGVVYRGRYQIGPAAQGSDFFIFELLSHAKQFHDLVGPVVDYLALAEVVRRLFRFGRNRRMSAYAPASPAFSPLVLQNLCHLFVKEQYHPRAKLESKWEVLTSQWYSGYSSPSHPTSGLEYKVSVKSYKGEYQFRVRGDGKVIVLQLVSGRRVYRLQPPSLLQEEEASIEGGEKARG